jgi:hypothetical protein
MLVRALANISLCYVPGPGVLFTTMERGYYLVPENEELATAVVGRLPDPPGAGRERTARDATTRDGLGHPVAPPSHAQPPARTAPIS